MNKDRLDLFVGNKPISPGPWKVAKTDNGDFGIVSWHNEWLAQCFPWAKPESNARLIAEAPAMYELLASIHDNDVITGTPEWYAISELLSRLKVT